MSEEWIRALEFGFCLWLLPVTRAWFRDREGGVCVSCTAFAEQGENVLDAYQAKQIIIYA